MRAVGAQLLTGGRRLAGVGGRIVAEVFLGLLKADSRSYSNDPPRRLIWREEPPRVAGRAPEASGYF